MAYNKTTWQNGDVITAEKLNNIENGIEETSSSEKLMKIDIEITHGAETQVTVSKTFSELKSLMTENTVQIPAIISQKIAGANIICEYYGYIAFNNGENTINIGYEYTSYGYGGSEEIYFYKKTITVDANNNATLAHNVNILLNS